MYAQDHTDLNPNPNDLDFGDVDVDDDKTKTVTIVNEYAGSITIDQVSIDGDNEFDVESEDCEGTLADDAECEIDVVFEPTDEGSYDAVLEVLVNGDTDPLEIDLQGTSGDDGSSNADVKLTISDDSLDFEDTMVDYVSMKQFDLTNDGTESITIEDIGLYGDEDEHFDVYDRDCLDVTLAAGKSCNVLVFFEPSATGSMQSEIEILVDGEADEFIVELDGTAITASTDVSVSPIRKDFGVSEKGDAKSVTFTVDVSAASIRIDTSLTGSSDFKIHRDRCDGEDIGSTEDENECDITINYDSVHSGFIGAVLEINADDEDFFIPVYAFVDGEDVVLTDIKGTTFEAFINRLVNAGVVGGYSDSTFKPEESVTRGQLAKFIFNAFDITKDVTCEKFSDVDTTNTFYDEITSLKCAEIIAGYPDGTYKPDNSVTRGEVTKFISMAMDAKGINIDLEETENFADVEEANTFYDYIAYLSSITFEGQKVISGYADGEFKSSETLTRGQMAKMIDVSMRYYESL